MFWLLLATGLTGGLTLVYMVRLVSRQLWAEPTVHAFFSPRGGCTDAILREINAAGREVLVLAYGFTSRPIAEALVQAKMRGVKVEIVLDHSNEHDPHSDIHFLLAQGLVPVVDDHHAIAHNKIMLIDGHTILTGSFNFTNHAEHSNAENLVILKHHHDLVVIYRQDFEVHKAHARAAEAKVAPAEPAKEHEAKAGHAHKQSAVDEAFLSNVRATSGLSAAAKQSKDEEELDEKPSLPPHRKDPPARAA
jgi:phosphatidylserine/phosphatidylglycerophosphate/cardiolipin synthase-like enzyme